MLEIQLVSGLEKILPESAVLNAPVFSSDVAAQGETYSFQIALRCNEEGRHVYRIESSSELKHRIRIVKCVPVLYAGPGEDHEVLRNNEPGLYPDLLAEPDMNGQVRLVPHLRHCLWVTVYVSPDQKPGTYPVKVTLHNTDSDETVSCPEFNLEVKPFKLLPQELTCYHWFHTDCLFNYYKVPCWSEEHWRIIENFARNAAEHGTSMLYTPLWTPPLDTAVGYARPTCQLLEIQLDLKTMQYTFGFDKLRRWIELGKRTGFTKFGMSHIFTQWGAAFTPKIMANLVNASENSAAARYGADSLFNQFKEDQPAQIFGWQMKSDSPEYRDFLTRLFPPLLDLIRECGLDKNTCFFSLSDEPHEEHLAIYTKLVELVKPLLQEFETVEALSNYGFYKHGLVKNPFPAIHHLHDFEGNVEKLNAYYCCIPVVNAPNRFIGMPAYRTRMLGLLSYVHNLNGFLHWGFNFYYCQYSKWPIDPFACTDADGAFPAGDAFLVYPGEDGQPLDSMRNELIAAGWQDMRACRTLEKMAGRDAVLKLLNDGLERPLQMMDFPRGSEFLLKKRRAVYEAISAFLQ